MNSYATTLIFCAMIGVVVSAALKMQAVQSVESKHLFERIEAQKKAAKKQMRAVWVQSGDLVEKKSVVSIKNRGRSLPYRRVDIMPLFAKDCDGAFESLVLEISQMPHPLFDAFLRSARQRFEEKKGAITLWDLVSLPFDDPKKRAAYFAHCKGKNSWLRHIKVENLKAKIPIHQIHAEMISILFDPESAQRIVEKRTRLISDSNEPLWNEGDLLKLKTKNPLWRSWIQAGLDTQSEYQIIEQTTDGSACVERITNK